MNDLSDKPGATLLFVYCSKDHVTSLLLSLLYLLRFIRSNVIEITDNWCVSLGTG